MKATVESGARLDPLLSLPKGKVIVCQLVRRQSAEDEANGSRRSRSMVLAKPHVGHFRGLGELFQGLSQPTQTLYSRTVMPISVALDPEAGGMMLT